MSDEEPLVPRTRSTNKLDAAVLLVFTADPEDLRAALSRLRPQLSTPLTVPYLPLTIAEALGAAPAEASPKVQACDTPAPRRARRTAQSTQNGQSPQLSLLGPRRETVAATSNGHAPEPVPSSANGTNGHVPDPMLPATNGHVPKHLPVAANGRAPDPVGAATDGQIPEPMPVAMNGHAPNSSAVAANGNTPAEHAINELEPVAVGPTENDTLSKARAAPRRPRPRPKPAGPEPDLPPQGSVIERSVAQDDAASSSPGAERSVAQDAAALNSAGAETQPISDSWAVEEAISVAVAAAAIGPEPASEATPAPSPSIDLVEQTAVTQPQPDIPPDTAAAAASSSIQDGTAQSVPAELAAITDAGDEGSDGSATEGRPNEESDRRPGSVERDDAVDDDLLTSENFGETTAPRLPADAEWDEDAITAEPVERFVRPDWQRAFEPAPSSQRQRTRVVPLADKPPQWEVLIPPDWHRVDAIREPRRGRAPSVIVPAKRLPLERAQRQRRTRRLSRTDLAAVALATLMGVVGLLLIYGPVQTIPGIAGEMSRIGPLMHAAAVITLVALGLLLVLWLARQVHSLVRWRTLTATAMALLPAGLIMSAFALGAATYLVLTPGAAPVGVRLLARQTPSLSPQAAAAPARATTPPLLAAATALIKAAAATPALASKTQSPAATPPGSSAGISSPAPAASSPP